MVLNKSEYYELPIKYDETIVRLLVQSPKRMYAYWEVSNDKIKNFSEKFFDYNNCIPVLRVINITKNYFYEIEIDPYANNYYIDVEDENCNYRVELGRKFKNKFVDIYMSNQVTIPSDVPSSFNIGEDGILFKNYICLDNTKIKVKLPRYDLRQDYGDLPFGKDFENISSMEKIK